MSNMLLATPVLSDAATLTGSTASGDLTISNLQTMSLKQVYRAADASAVYIAVDLGAASEVNLVALIGHSGSSRSYARVRAADSEADVTADPAYDSGDLPFRSHQSGYDSIWAAGVQDENRGALEKNMFLHYFSAQNYRYWRIDITDPNSTYLDMGRLYLADAWQPVVNMDYGFAQGYIDPSRKARTVSGEMLPLERTKYRYSEFKLSFASEDELFDNAFEIERLRGRTKDVLFVHDPAATTHLQRRALYGAMEGLQPIINTTFSIFEKTFRIEEIPS